jgi:hypothetical protein
MLNCIRLNALPVRLKTSQGCPLLIVQKDLGTALKGKKKKEK